jgi:hypothetical protein
MVGFKLGTNIEHKQIDRITIRGEMQHRGFALDWCYAYGYEVCKVGPEYSFGKVDTNYFVIVAEAEQKIVDFHTTRKLQSKCVSENNLYDLQQPTT